MCCDRRGNAVVPCSPPHPSQRVGSSAPETTRGATTTSGETMSDRFATSIAEAMLNMPSPIAAEEFEPGFWRSCATWEQIVEKATPAILAALKANRIALVELPEPSSDEYGNTTFADGTVVTFKDGWTQLRLEDIGRDDTYDWDDDQLRDFGAALIAAAAEVSGE
ncbi:DNA methyltransferase [Mycobacterium phage Sbash]|uniref:Uncharacterized protein n=1 Tax=Mycobacterium phage Sbash TaxID=1567475 RepID=A0A0A7RXX4_9CAUD|nr:DNA methyltransferase [Mycobacterium phage Sbash]AJA43367.1 hypothetical protein PBI_SBASH_66 [Mycobacterium phage Sbash]